MAKNSNFFSAQRQKVQTNIATPNGPVGEVLVSLHTCYLDRTMHRIHNPAVNVWFKYTEGSMNDQTCRAFQSSREELLLCLIPKAANLGKKKAVQASRWSGRELNLPRPWRAPNTHSVKVWIKFMITPVTLVQHFSIALWWHTEVQITWEPPNIYLRKHRHTQTHRHWLLLENIRAIFKVPYPHANYGFLP